MSRRTSVLMALATFLIAMTLISATANNSQKSELAPAPTPGPEYTLERTATTQVNDTCELRAYALKGMNTIPANLIVDRVFVTVCANTAAIEGK